MKRIDENEACPIYGTIFFRGCIGYQREMFFFIPLKT